MAQSFSKKTVAQYEDIQKEEVQGLMCRLFEAPKDFMWHLRRYVLGYLLVQVVPV